MKNSFKQAGISIFGLAAACASIGRAEARDLFAAHGKAPVEQQGGADHQMDEIVVTAQKREQNINDVGVTIAALSGDSLRWRQINSAADLANSVPSLSFTYSTQGTPVLTLRGVGFYEASLAAYQTVAVYVDEVPLPFPAMTAHTNLDLERLEVLKGPQGTLFGQNSTGGAINFIAAKPTDSFAAGAELGYGRFNTFTAEGFVSGPLSDKIKIRIAGRVEHGDGWQTSVTRPDDRNGAKRNYLGRVLVDFQPSEGVRFQLNLNGWRDRSDTQAAQLIGLNWQNPTHVPYVASFPFTRENDRASDWLPGLPFADNRQFQASLRGDIDLIGDIVLTSITSYVDYKQRQADSIAGMPYSIIDILHDDGRAKSFTQELRVSNGARSKFRWILGGNFERSSVDQTNANNYKDASINPQYALIGFPITSSFNTSNQDMRNYAAFANAEYDVARQLTVKAGLRYSVAKRTVFSCISDLSGTQTDLGGLFYFLSKAFSGVDPGPYVAGTCASLNNLDNPPTFRPSAFNGRLDENNVSWRIGAEWKPTNAVLAYANISKGYKAGSFPVLASTALRQYLPAKQESVLAYEAGVKATLVDRLVQLNGAAFYYDYKDKQLRSKLIDPLFGLVDVLQNIPKSSIKGAEVELHLTPARRFSIDATATYLDAKIEKFTGVNAAGLIDDFAGTRMPFTPKWQAGLAANYDTPLNEHIAAFLGGSINYRSSTSAIIGGDVPLPSVISPYAEPFRIDGYTLVDANFGIRSLDDQWRFQIWGKNIFDKYYWNNVNQNYDVIIRYAGTPATYGATLSYRFR